MGEREVEQRPPFEKSAHLLVESPVKKAILSTIQAGLSYTPLFHGALCLDVLIPRIGISIEVIIAI